uniref:tRNA (34-2'-O)-methyltransferase regulator WDR6 n=1 Tax=Anolis carolinensis TaxID=28377 RepID=G1KM73_ANOCA|nr:PREDICTED: WD repeat-containing protein 6 [Anolis carolinensis]XP_008103645.1 PREDICTED: WD repeat-containing protein 6 [Anolis carolinensis]XP_008103646.1 PREDICTED: WD repeat-containing protein 6 [Anolis carolinensis]XP_008103647.1 PREDICTED: WD repeat-containing protein 6 [Anolis carolinensis]|eukprot:XP_003217908.1 PREDICTED: WD repeat-containing protein 6 [Anolis carolinensis]
METELLLAPITALEIVGDHLLAGEGPNLAIYSLEPDGSHSARCSKQVLRNCNIHGIKEQQNVAPEASGSAIVAIFGGKNLAVVRLSFQNGQVNIVELFPLCELHDWIWDLQWLDSKAETPNCVALALGHNSVALYDCVGQRVFQEVHCQEKCILYSAHLVGSNWDALILVAGTVFNQLVIWGMADPPEGPGRIKPRCRISGHKGVIFSICFMESKGILASASDDRSLRLWAIGNIRAPPEHIPCLLVCYGHQARVWSVRLLSDCIISIGEDSVCLVWDYKGEIVQSFKGHKGRGLWAVAVHEGRRWVFTGGTDSGIRRWSLKSQRAGGSSLSQLNFTSPKRKGSPRVVKLINVNRLLILTDAGVLYLYDLISKVWVSFLEDAAYRSYGLLEVSEIVGGAVVCAMGNLSGQVKIFPLHSPTQSKDLQLYEGKVHSLSWAPFPGQHPDTCSLCVSGPAGAMLWLEVSCHPHDEVTVVVKQCFLLPLCKQRWHTCATFLPHGELLLCGDRRGSVMVFACRPALTPEEMSGSGELDSSGSGVICETPGLLFPLRGDELCADGPVSLLFGLHGKLGVTSVTCHGDFVYSMGRDGCYRQLQVQGHQLQVLRKQKPCRSLEWLEELRFAPDGSMRVLGFHAAHFVLWSARTNETLLSIPCGGGHRSWSYSHCLSAETFAYIKSGDVLVYHSEAIPSEQCVLTESLHGRELTCVCHVATLRSPQQEPVSILATGSEDNTVNILAFGWQSRSMVQLTMISDHISSVRALAVAKSKASHPESTAAVLFSAGGRAQIECYRLQLSLSCGSCSGVSCQLVHVASHRLDEQWDRMKNKHKYIKMDPETRYMSTVVLNNAEDVEQPGSLLFLAAACSDGSVRLFLLLEHAQKLWLVAESFHHQRCVLKVQAFVHKAPGGKRRHFLGSAATDGSIAFWDITDTLDCATEIIRTEGREVELLALGTPVLTLQAHSCGVNSFHVQDVADGIFSVASGSDDGSISISAVEVNDRSAVSGESAAGTGIRILRTFSRLGAHAAHVTGLRLLPRDFLLSASVDQRLTLWRICKGGLSFVLSKFCHVADVAALETWEVDSNCGSVICGQGLEVLSCSLEEQGTEINDVV